MSRSLVFAIPGDLATRTGGYVYDRRIIDELRGLGWGVEHLELPASFPAPSPGDLARTQELFGRIANGRTVLVDGLAFGAMADIAEAEAARLDLVALIHHPLATEGGFDGETAQRLRAGERRALATARRVIVTSPATAREVEKDYRVAPSRIVVALPGIEPGRRRAPVASSPLLILSAGTLTRRKGHDILVAALAAISDLQWHCRILGSPLRSPATAAALANDIAKRGLGGRVVLAGEVEDTRAEMEKADLFALATRHEGYGMVFAEAMAHGVPIVGTRVGAVPELVPEGAGILVPPDDPPALAAALATLLRNPALRQRLGEGAFRAAAGLPSWRQSAEQIAAALEGGR